MPAVLESKWGGLSPHLIASFYEVDKDGNSVGGTIVNAPITEGDLNISTNWNNPFEGSGAESKAPTLAAMLQSGQAQPFIDLAGKYNLIGEQTAKNISSSTDKLIGKTGITKLNSTQVFTSVAPVKFNVTLLFRAWSDAKKEVDEPVSQLTQWTLPKFLSNDGSLLARLANVAGSGAGIQGFIDVLLPSDAPALIAMNYKGKTYSPLVIDSIGHSITSPIDKNANTVTSVVTLSLSTLSAIDAMDWKFL